MNQLGLATSWIPVPSEVWNKEGSLTPLNGTRIRSKALEQNAIFAPNLVFCPDSATYVVN